MIPERYKYMTEERWNSLKTGTIYEEDIRSGATVYFDMDGTLAVWNTESLKYPGEKMTMDEIEERGYFRNLKPIPEVIEKAKLLKDLGYNVCILSKAYFHAIEEKTDWIKENMPFIDVERDVYFVPLTANKSLFVPPIKFDDILIDDYNDNLNNWSGTPLKVVTDKNSKRDDIICFNFNDENSQFLDKLDEAVRQTAEKRDLDLYFSDVPEIWLDDEGIREKLENLIRDIINDKENIESEYPRRIYEQLNLSNNLDAIVYTLQEAEFYKIKKNEDYVISYFDYYSASLTKHYDLCITAEMDDTVGFYDKKVLGFHLSDDLKREIAKTEGVINKKINETINKAFEEFYKDHEVEIPTGEDMDNMEEAWMETLKGKAESHKRSVGKGL